MLRPTRALATAAAVLVPLTVATGSGAPRVATAVPVAAVPAPVATVPGVATVADRSALAGVLPTVDAVRPSKPRPVLGGPARDGHADIPYAALSAYQRAVMIIERVDPDCGLSWELLAAIGRIESDHGRYAGATLADDGTSSPAIRGPILNGRGAFATVHDTDAGQVDGSARWDRAVGPMQFLPSTWAVVGVDADGDGTRSADDLDDAALGAGVYLCAAPGDLTTRAGTTAALLRYNPSRQYVRDVLTVARDYEHDQFPSSALPVEALMVRVRAAVAGADGERADQSGHGQDRDHGDGHEKGHGKGDGGRPHGEVDGTHGQPGKPGKDPQSPSDPTDPTEPTVPTEPTGPWTEPSDPETPVDPEPLTLTGVLAPCAGDPTTWCLDDTLLDVGDAAYLDSVALADLDGDGTTGTNREELTALTGTTVSVLVDPVAGDAAPPALLRVDDLAYRAG